VGHGLHPEARKHHQLGAAVQGIRTQLSQPQLSQPQWLDKAAWPYAPRSVNVGPGYLHYVDEGPRNAPSVLLVHGTPTWSFEYRRAIAALSAERRVIAVDHMGFGLSERPKSFSYRPEDHARNLRAFVDALKLDRFSLVVHDFGGPIALPLALDGRADKLVVFNTWMWKFDDEAMLRRARFAGSGLARLLYRYANASQRIIMPSAYGDRRKLTREIHGQYLGVFPDAESRELVLHTLAKALLGSSEYYQSLWNRRAALLQIPVLLLWGMKDSAFQPPYFERWKSIVPQATVLTLPEAGHWPHEEVPEQWNEAVLRFLKHS